MYRKYMHWHVSKRVFRPLRKNENRPNITPDPRTGVDMCKSGAGAGKCTGGTPRGHQQNRTVGGATTSAQTAACSQPPVQAPARACFGGLPYCCTSAYEHTGSRHAYAHMREQTGFRHAYAHMREQLHSAQASTPPKPHAQTSSGVQTFLTHIIVVPNACKCGY